MSKHYVCKCNNCETVMFDENPSTNLVDIDLIDEPIENMETTDNGVWGCPNCRTDEYLTDYIPTVDTRAETYLQFAQSVRTLACDIETLSELVHNYSADIKHINKYECDEVGMFGIDLNLQSKTTDAIKKLITDELKETQQDWLQELDGLRQALLLKVTKL